jgi:hypothetical protein
MLVLAIVAASGTARAQGGDYDYDPRDIIARVIASGGIGGRFGRPVCRHGVDLEPSSTALYTYALVREAHAGDHAMVLDTGGLLAPHGVARYAAVTDPASLAEMIDELGYRALAFGSAELGSPRGSLLDVLRRLRNRGIPSIASNLSCNEDASDLCDLLVDASDGPSIQGVGADLSMAVLAFMWDDVLSLIAPDLSEGISIAPIAESMPRQVRLARARGAEIVVAIAAVSSSEALALVQQLPEGGRPDLVILAGSGELLFARPATVVPAIASPPSGDAIEIVIRESQLRARYQMEVQPLGRGTDVGDPVRDFTERIGEEYCDEWGRSLPGADLERGLDVAGLTELTARIVLDRSDADVAIINRGALDQRWRPARPDALTASDVYIALAYDEPIFVAEVPSTWITALAQRAADRGLVTPGLSWDGSSARVLDRPLQARARYRVATLRFLASGGDHALPPLPTGSTWVPLESGTLRSIVLERWQRRSDRDPRDALPDPRVAPEWIAQGTIDGTFSGSSIRNPARYATSLLERGSTVALGLEVNLRADATAPDWSWENLGVLRYRAQWAPSPMPGVEGAFSEAVDQIQVRSLGAWRGLRKEPGLWYVPDPFVEVFVESEISAPAMRGWHWLLFRPTIGARFPLTSELELKLGTGPQAQLLQPGSEAEWGVGATITLRPWDLLRVEERHVTLSALLDWFLVDLGDQNRWQLRSSFDASFDLAGPLALTLGVRLYLQQDRGQDLGVALDATAGLRLGWLGRAVGP